VRVNCVLTNKRTHCNTIKTQFLKNTKHRFFTASRKPAIHCYAHDIGFSTCIISTDLQPRGPGGLHCALRAAWLALAFINLSLHTDPLRSLSLSNGANYLENCNIITAPCIARSFLKGGNWVICDRFLPLYYETCKHSIDCKALENNEVARAWH